MSPVEPLAPWQTAWPLLPILMMVGWGAWHSRREVRFDPVLLGVVCLALCVRVVWMPVGRHIFDGHEAEYLDVYMGTRELTRGGPLFYPAMQWLYRGFGLPFRHPGLLLALCMAASLLSISAFYGWVYRLLGRSPAIAGALLLAVWGNHAFWATSAYNVVLPHAFSMVAIWGLVCLGSAQPPRGAAWLAGGAAALAMATRVESVVWVPVGLAILVALKPRGVREWLGPLVLGGVLGGVSAAYVLWPGTVPGAGPRAISFANNVGMLDYFAPMEQPFYWLLPVLGLVLGWRGQRWVAGGLILAVVGGHLLFSTFDDYGFRHALIVLPAVVALMAGLATKGFGRGVLAVFLVPLLLHTQEVANRYYMGEDDFAAQLDPSLKRVGVEALGSCALICEDGRIVEEGDQKSHFNLLDPAESESLRAQQGCLQWLSGIQDHRWSSRAVHDRALRLEHLFELTPSAVVTEDGLGYVGVLFEVGNRKRGMAVP